MANNDPENVKDDNAPKNERDDNSLEIEVIDHNTPENEVDDGPPELPGNQEADSPDEIEVMDETSPAETGDDSASENVVMDETTPAETGDDSASENVVMDETFPAETGDGSVSENVVMDDTTPAETGDGSASKDIVMDETFPAETEDDSASENVVMDETSPTETGNDNGPEMVMDETSPVETGGDTAPEHEVRGYNTPENVSDDNGTESDPGEEAAPEVTLDDSAEQLYRQFSGIDDADRAGDSGPSHSELMELLSQEEKKLDYFRLLLAQATCLFAEIITNSRFASLSKENDQKIKVFLDTLKKLVETPKFDGTISCRLRGQQQPEETGSQQEGNGNVIGGAETYDYQLSCGNLLLDHQMARTVEEREKSKGEAIYSKLMQSFKGMSLMNIFNFSIEVGAGEDEDLLKIENTLKHLARFYDNESNKVDFFVKDEYGQSNINLSILAATNNVQAAALQNLVNKIKEMMFGENAPAELQRFTTVYDVILASKRYRKQLPKTAIEVNNMQALMRGLQKNQQTTVESIQVSRLVLAKYGSNPRMASEVISSINSDGYSEIGTEVMGKRLSLATGFLKLTEETDNKDALQKEALQNIEDGLDKAPEEIYDNLTVKNGEVHSVNAEGKSTKWSLHEKLAGMISFFKQRSATKKKVLDITNKDVKFDSADYEVIARNFDVGELEASHLVELLRNCFNEKGRFLRNFFVRNIPEFVKYDTKVFEFLWHYLRGLALEEDRVSFLNGLQLLVPQLNRPEDALKVLLVDIFTRSAVVNFSDRNGLMLANILLRKKNREEKSNIELTPEEVLLVQSNLDHDKVRIVLDFFEENNEHLMRKVRHITEALLKSSKQKPEDKNKMETRFLLHLNRELVIFLALVGGDKAKAIISGSIREFGQPASSYYKEMIDKKNLKHSLQYLQVAVRALRRFDDPVSAYLFEEVAGREVLFVGLWEEEPSYAPYVKRIMDRIMQKDGG